MVQRNFEKYKKMQIIKMLNLKQKKHDFDGVKMPDGVKVYTGRRETDAAIYHYTLDNLFAGDFYLTVERYSKTAKPIWNNVLQAYFPRKTTKFYRISEG